MNNKFICVFDLETNGINLATTSPVEIAAVMICPHTLQIIPGSEFSSFCKPDFDTNEPGALTFHCELRSKQEGKYITHADLLNEWGEYPAIDTVWPLFVNYTRQYHTRQDRISKFTAPLPGGFNIVEFDLPIVNRIHERYGDGKALFGVRDRADLLQWLFPWMEGSPEVSSLSLDNMREHFGLSKEKAHSAVEDVRQTAMLICRFMRFHREIAKSKNWFKDAFSTV